MSGRNSKDGPLVDERGFSNSPGSGDIERGGGTASSNSHKENGIQEIAPFNGAKAAFEDPKTNTSHMAGTDETVYMTWKTGDCAFRVRYVCGHILIFLVLIIMGIFFTLFTAGKAGRIASMASGRYGSSYLG